ncbi:MAG TPA: hypothetical protein VMX15_06015 [Candidatus Heimdallarchaeota archaeon]|nr:hypothetical protein [Candidatus Heimdallarchaeota archaeon]
MSEIKAGPTLVTEESTPESAQRKGVFRQNITDLVYVLHVNQKQAAQMIGVQYKWLWRMAKKGISRIDDRNLPNLQKVAAYFEVPSTDEFWREGLICWLLASQEACPFVEKFKPNLEETYLRESAKLASVKNQLMEAIGNHPDIVLRIRSSPQTSKSPAMTVEEKLAALVDLGTYDKLKESYDAQRASIHEAYEREFSDDKTRKTATG